jgi:hypothetical protein
MVVPPDTPICYVRGIIKDVQFEKERTSPPEVDGEIVNPPGVMPDTKIPAQYRLTVLIKEVTSIGGNKESEKCENIYKIDSENTLFIYSNRVREGDELIVDQLIRGEVWNGYFRSYSLS